MQLRAIRSGENVIENERKNDSENGIKKGR